MTTWTRAGGGGDAVSTPGTPVFDRAEPQPRPTASERKRWLATVAVKNLMRLISSERIKYSSKT
jgi:hypothetical protein